MVRFLAVEDFDPVFDEVAVLCVEVLFFAVVLDLLVEVSEVGVCCFTLA